MLVLCAHACTGVGAKKAATAAAAHPLKSLPSTEWPVYGTVSSWASGIRAATAFAPELGVRRSCSPERISVGTLGRALAAGGAGEASGQESQTGTRLLWYAVVESKGKKSP